MRGRGLGWLDRFLTFCPAGWAFWNTSSLRRFLIQRKNQADIAGMLEWLVVTISGKDPAGGSHEIANFFAGRRRSSRCSRGVLFFDTTADSSAAECCQ
jgi:hypothetical protein